MKRAVSLALSACLIVGCEPPASTKKEVRPTPTTIAVVAGAQSVRFYGTAPAVVALDGASDMDSNGVSVLGFSKGPAAAYRPEPIVIGAPLVEPRGMVKGRKFLYISDSGKDKNHKAPATIWRLDPTTKKIDVFYRGSLLTSSKWLWFLEGRDGSPDKLIISDFGEEPIFHGQGSGVGAKVFTIDVKPNGSAGEARLVFSGPPLHDPQGITVIGNTIILADTRAGEPRKRFDAPSIQFRNGVLFALPLSGGAPTRLFPEATFVTLVGACAYRDGDNQYLRVWDIDGGRRDTSRFAWMPHSGFSALKRAKVESVDPLKLGPLEDVPLIEEFPIDLQSKKLKQGQTVVLAGVEGTTLSGGRERIVLQPDDVVPGRVSVITESPTIRPTIVVEVTIVNEDGTKDEFKRIEIPKPDMDPLAPFRDNKHAGAVRGGRGLDTSVDGISKSVTLFPNRGGIVANVWRGGPLVTPMASQPSWDEKFIWVTDLDGGPAGTGAVWQIPMPPEEERYQMYSARRAWMTK